jgi:hypothetical protein
LRRARGPQVHVADRGMPAPTRVTASTSSPTFDHWGTVAQNGIPHDWGTSGAWPWSSEFAPAGGTDGSSAGAIGPQEAPTPSGRPSPGAGNRVVGMADPCNDWCPLDGLETSASHPNAVVPAVGSPPRFGLWSRALRIGSPLGKDLQEVRHGARRGDPCPGARAAVA